MADENNQDEVQPAAAPAQEAPAEAPVAAEGAPAEGAPAAEGSVPVAAGPPPSAPEGRRPFGGGKRFQRRKVCAFCVDHVDYIDYKDMKRLRKFVTERGKILPRRISGTCATHQRMLTTAVKRARNIALVPFKAD